MSEKNQRLLVFFLDDLISFDIKSDNMLAYSIYNVTILYCTIVYVLYCTVVYVV